MMLKCPCETRCTWISLSHTFLVIFLKCWRDFSEILVWEQCDIGDIMIMINHPFRFVVIKFKYKYSSSTNTTSMTIQNQPSIQVCCHQVQVQIQHQWLFKTNLPCRSVVITFLSPALKEFCYPKNEKKDKGDKKTKTCVCDVGPAAGCVIRNIWLIFPVFSVISLCFRCFFLWFFMCFWCFSSDFCCVGDMGQQVVWFPDQVSELMSRVTTKASALLFFPLWHFFKDIQPLVSVNITSFLPGHSHWFV